MSELPEAFAAALRDRYVLERELGRGGMATVYLAQDVRHKRPVALKVLHPELGASLGPERFAREIEFAARLQHPHILTVLDSGETGAQLWFTMPFVEGESLRARLRRERQISVEDALQIAREAARALDYAHQHGVIHRDIKPENILLTRDGSTLVADFGIARALAGTDERLTATGLAVGTPAYMSPEQASGDAALDPRTDVYSLGCVLYEMLAGEPPYASATVQAMLLKRLTEPVPSVLRVRPTVPVAVDEAIRRALAPLAADRFAGAGEFARALQSAATLSAVTPAPAAPTPMMLPSTSAATPAATAPTVPVSVPSASGARTEARRLPTSAIPLGLGVLIALGVLFAWRRTHAVPGDSPKVLAVLPFENLGDSADAYFADGVTDEVRSKLARLGSLEVIARNSSTEYRHTAKRPEQIARELRAKYLLTATVRWERQADGASRVRVTPELVDVSPGHAPSTRWSEQFDAALTDVFQVQADIAGKVASALDVALGDSARRELAAKPTQNLAAYEDYLKGEAASQGMAVIDPPSLRQAIGFYEQAVALDSSFVVAWAQLAWARATLYLNGTPTPELAAGARQAVERARALGPERPETQLALGNYYRYVETDQPRALAAFEAGLKLAPRNADLLVSLAHAEQALGRWEASLSALQKAQALDPRSAAAARRTVQSLLFLRRYPEAQAAAERALTLAPANLSVIEDEAVVALAQGDLARARAVVHRAVTAREPAAVLAYFANYWDLYWVLDDAEQQQLLALPPSAFDDDRGVWGIVRAQTYYLRGDRAKARIYADSARLALAAQVRATPDDGQRHVILGLALAYLGRKAEAIQEGERGAALVPVSRDATAGPYIQHQLVRIYLLVGEPEHALDRLEQLLATPYFLSPAWLRIDPTFAPLKGNPRFERLVAGP